MSTRPFLLLAALACPLAAQHLRFGVIGGTAVTQDYPLHCSPGACATMPDGGVVTFPQYCVRSASRSPIGGAALEWAFTDRFSIEANAIYRRLRLQGPVPTVTWQFPVLAKYRFAEGRLSPFIEAGPSFRTTGNLNTNPSHTGLTAGAGLSQAWRGFRVEPTVRYTRWAADPRWTTPSKRDQVEALLSFTRAAAKDRRPFGDRVRFGAVMGMTLLVPLEAVSFRAPEIPPGQRIDNSRDYNRTWILGPRLDVLLTPNFSLTGEANYRQIRFKETRDFDFVDASGIRRQGTASYNGKAAVLWQFPILLRYTASTGTVRPFVQAGPSFRLPQELGAKLSTLGATAGAGVRLQWRGIGMEPELRFTHWGPAKLRNGEIAPNEVRRNQLDAMFAIVF